MKIDLGLGLDNILKFELVYDIIPDCKSCKHVPEDNFMSIVEWIVSNKK